MFGISNTFSTLFIEFNPNSKSPEIYSISSSNAKFVVDFSNNVAFMSTEDSKWKWDKIPINENIYVSHMSKKFISEIVNNCYCDLPMLSESIISHDYLLRSITGMFKQSLDLMSDELPIA